MNKNLEYFLGLNYPVLIRKISEDGEEYYFAEVPDLPGCMAHGSTPDEALECLEELKQLWIEERLAQGYPVPEPRELEEFSGKFVQRLPKSLHRELTIQSKRNRVSLNQYVVNLLSKAVAKEEVKEEILAEIRRIFESKFAIFTTVTRPQRVIYYSKSEQWDDILHGTHILASGEEESSKVQFWGG